VKHHTSCSDRTIKANLTRCRNALAKARIVLSKRVEEVDLVGRVQNPPEWLLQRLKENETAVWFYEKQIREYEQALKDRGIPFGISPVEA
jgi:hypothetical protein